jgi:2-iminoacetate synthase
MEFAIPGFIKRYCTPNAMLTLREYAVDYGSPEVKEKSQTLIDRELAKMPEGTAKSQLVERLAAIDNGQRDLYF